MQLDKGAAGKPFFLSLSVKVLPGEAGQSQKRFWHQSESVDCVRKIHPHWPWADTLQLVEGSEERRIWALFSGTETPNFSCVPQHQVLSLRLQDFPSSPLSFSDLPPWTQTYTPTSRVLRPPAPWSSRLQAAHGRILTIKPLSFIYIKRQGGRGRGRESERDFLVMSPWRILT